MTKKGGTTVPPFLTLILVLACSYRVAAQGDGSGLNSLVTIQEIKVEFSSSDPTLLRNTETLEATIISKLRIFSRDHVRPSDIDFAVQRVASIPEVAEVKYHLDLSSGTNYILVLVVTPAPVGMMKPAITGLLTNSRKGSFPYLINSKNAKIKLDFGATVSPVAGLNGWLNNGEFFTLFSPFGKDYPKNGSFATVETAVFAGATAVFRITDHSFIYGNYRVLLANTLLGRDLYRTDNPYSLLAENLYGGIVGSFTSKKGNLFTYNLSAGRQPFRIGTGMLICQIGLNGGDRGALNVWPRFSGDFVGLAQFRYNNLKAEYFYIDPNEFGGFETNTRLSGINFDYTHQTSRVKAGFTYVRALQSTAIYMFPDGSFESRDGLNAFNLRVEKEPKPGTRAVIAKFDGGMQTNNRFPMRAFGLAAEVGYLNGYHKLKPSLTYRLSHLTGDNPDTQRFERWDFLYSGNDVDTWIQGLIMKNILFNTNLQAHRVQGQILYNRWRLTMQYFYFRSDQVNNKPLAINEFASNELGHQLTILAEKSFLKRFYTRLQVHSLWTVEGINGALPNPAKKPWLGAQAMLRYQI